MIGLGLLVLLAGIGMLVYGNRQSSSGAASGATPAAALASEHSPTLGEPTAGVHIVEFLDPACETCAVFFPIVKRLMAENPGRIRLSTRHVAFHDGAEVPVRVLEASRAQDKYWETLQGLFATQPRWAVNHRVDPQEVLRVAAEIGLDMERLEADMNSPAVTERIERDRVDARILKVTATPGFFVNGKPLPSFGEQQLRALVAAAVDEAY
jgi:protein-disulfide isomerase